nr:ammonium transporter Rh type B [Sinonovacula constricta]
MDHAVDAGESMYIHAFGAYFGLAVAFVLYNKHAMGHEKAGSAYNNDIVAFIGTIFLWLYWPSFNGGGMDGDEQHRGYINTYLSLAAATIVTFGLSAFYDKHGKFSADHIQNATLAGGVAVGTAAGMPLQPWGAIVMGSVAGFISVTGFRFLSGFMAKRMRIHDTCGVHNLHGMPAILAAVAGSIVAAMSTEEKWGRSD